MESDDDIDYVGDTEEVCLICSESGKDELWYACSSCKKISQSTLESYNNKYHVEIVSNLRDNYKKRSKDVNESAIVAQLVVSPFTEIDIQQFATSVTQNFSEDIAATEMEAIAFQNDLALKSLVSNTKCMYLAFSK
ncbi:unnamed protein product [Acanthoscelides obtectus]|uniref:Uncharacterized protein n=1 Tax=Acanthoscelides obtectus TaxID=200917 RepID=A0A9P0KT41_ACAOB|nr:unnamed protein product [Acanthoscelides obtectus]CAK1634380.1 hypothetical protein AOBTE_LOCUS8738 [Acanthoscelides obtectus]